MNTTHPKTGNGAAGLASGAKNGGSETEVFIVNRGPVALGVTPMRPVESFETKSASVNLAILEIVVRLEPWLERTRLVPFAGPGYHETVAGLLAEGYEPTKLVQAVTARGASWFPFRSLSFAIRGDEFYAPLGDGRVLRCHSFWDHEAKRFDLVAPGAARGDAFDALTRTEKHRR